MGQVLSNPREIAGDRLMGCRIAHLAFLVILGACDRADPPLPAPKSVDAPRVSPVAVADFTPFGGEQLGFVSWLEANGRFVVTHAFDADTNGDGKIDPMLGDHGEPEGDEPSVWLWYLVAPGEPQRWDEFITSDARDRWLVLRRDQELVAISAASRSTLDAADTRADPSPCAPPRQASFDPTGRWLVFPRADPDRAVVRRLSSGSEREIFASSPLWRAEAMPAGWTMLREVVEDTDGSGELEMPRRQGTCVCRWCAQFAKSMGAGALVGDRTSQRIVMSDDAEFSLDAPGPLPVTNDVVWSLATQELIGARSVPDGCQVAVVPIGEPHVLLRCGTTSRVWNVADDSQIALERQVQGLTQADLAHDGWVAVQMRDDDGKRRVGRLELGTGRIEMGPQALRWGQPHPSGWRVVADENTVSVYHPATGQAAPLPVSPARSLDGLVVGTNGAWRVVDPSGKVSEVLTTRPHFVSANGCYVAPHDRTRPTRGPFRLQCF